MNTGNILPATQQVDSRLAIAGQLAPADLPAIAAAGFRAVINNRPDGEAATGQPTSADIEAAARAAGLEYRYLPVPPSGHSPQQGQAMAHLVDELPAPVLAFCRTGRRSAALYQLGRSLP